MNTKDIILLRTLYEEKNITHTARRLFMSQPAVSERLKRLEEEFNCTLFIRQPRGILFTSEGESLYQYFEQAYTEYESVKATLQAASYDMYEPLHIGCSNIFAKYHMPPLLSKFKQLYPTLDMTMRSGFSTSRYKDFLAGELQVCIVRGDHNWQEQKHLLLQEPLCILSHHPIDVNQLESEPYIRYHTDPQLMLYIDEWWFSNYTRSPFTMIEVDDLDTGLKLVNEGLGFTILSESCLKDYPHLHAIPLTFKDGTQAVRNTWMYYRNNYESFHSVRTFVEFIRHEVNITI